jgi:hypothetical protein
MAGNKLAYRDKVQLSGGVHQGVIEDIAALFLRACQCSWTIAELHNL